MRKGFATRLLKAGRSRGRWSEEELHAYGDVMRQPKAARATVGIYRQFLLKELPGLARGEYAKQRLTVPTRLLAGTEDVAVKGDSLEGANADDLVVQWVDGAGHFLPERRRRSSCRQRASSCDGVHDQAAARVRRHGLRRLGEPAGAADGAGGGRGALATRWASESA